MVDLDHIRSIKRVAACATTTTRRLKPAAAEKFRMLNRGSFAVSYIPGTALTRPSSRPSRSASKSERRSGVRAMRTRRYRRMRGPVELFGAAVSRRSRLLATKPDPGTYSTTM
jgi:hypothetical protein